MTPELVIYDLDGVLVDSEWLVAEVWSTELAAYGVEIAPMVLVERFAGKTDTSMAEVLAAETGAAPARAMLEAVHARAGEALKTNLQAIDGAGDALAASPFLKCVCSNSGPDRIRASLAKTDLHHHFEDEALFSGVEAANPKPHPDIHLQALAQFGVAPGAAIVIEDSVTGVTAARAAGVPSIGFLGASHIADGHGQALLAAGAAALVERHEDMLKAIRAL